MQLIADILKSDLTSRTAADAVSALAGLYDDVSQVPKHEYKCLRDLLFSDPDPDDEGYDDLLNNAISAGSGAQHNMAERTIAIYSIVKDQPGAMQSIRKADSVGGETAQVAIHVKLAPAGALIADADKHLCRDVLLRVRHLIDGYVLAERRRKPGNLIDAYPAEAAACADHSICHWRNTFTGNSGMANYIARWSGNLKGEDAKEMIDIYYCDWHRVFGK